ncbi:MAG: PPC domain-containing protein [Phycisphaerales bacterium]
MTRQQRPDDRPARRESAPGRSALFALMAMVLTIAMTATQASAQYMVRSGQLLWLSRPTGHVQYLRINVPEGTKTLSIGINGSNGDADLYARHGSNPIINPFAPGQHAAFLTASGSWAVQNLTIQNPEPGIWHIAIHAYTGYSNLRCRATLRLDDGQNIWVSGHHRSQQFFAFYVPPNTPRVSFRITPYQGTQGDADLFIRRGAMPVRSGGRSIFDWASTRGSGQADSVDLDNPEPGMYYVMIYGYTRLNPNEWLLSAVNADVREYFGIQITPKFFRTPTGYDLYLRFTNHSNRPGQIYHVYNLRINGQQYNFDLPIRPVIEAGEVRGYRANLPAGTFVGFAGGTAQVDVAAAFFDASVTELRGASAAVPLP